MKPKRRIWISIGYLVFIVLFKVNGANFTQSPEVSVQNGQATITFSVSEATDVEVAILNASDKIVRHLAAGVLGGEYSAPAPLQSGLSQSLVWDGKDDYGSWPGHGPFRVRVRLGLTPEFERSMTTKVYPDPVGSDYYAYFPGGYNSIGEFITATHPVFGKITDHRVPGLDIFVSDVTDELFVKVYRYGASHLARIDGRTGGLNGIITTLQFDSDTWFWWGEPVLGWHGDYIYHDEANSQGKLFRFDINGQPAPWPGTGKNVLSGFPATDQHTRGQASMPDGSHYILHYSSQPERDYESGPFAVSKIKDGKIVKSEMIVIDGSVSGGIKVDAKGNLYIAARVKPKGEAVPSWVQGRLSGTYEEKFTQAWWADEMYGSILKFGPSGGSVRVTKGAFGDWGGGGDLIAGAGRSSVSGERSPAIAEGLIWMYFGYSHVLTHNSWRIGCWCNITRFDIDRFGRLFLPNTFENEYVVIDNNRNQILRLKNKDIVMAQKIPIGLGHQIEVTDRAMYIADHYNNQVLSFKLSAEQEALVQLSSLDAENGSTDELSTEIFLDNYPNPFNLTTTIVISCQPSAISKVNIHVFNVNGKIVKKLTADLPRLAAGKAGSRQLTAGITWNAAGLPGGIYFCQLKYGSFTKEHKMIFIP